MKFYLPFVLALYLSVCLTACTEKVYIDRPVLLKPDIVWLKECSVANLEGNLVADVIVQSVKNIQSLNNCNLDKKTLTEWLTAQEKNLPK